MRVSILARKYNGQKHHERPEAELLVETPTVSIGFSCCNTFVHHTAGKSWQEGGATLYYLPKDAYYNVYWESSKGADNRNVDLVYCHVATPVLRYGDRFEYIDLDLDVTMWTTGRCSLDDEDEFVEHARRWAYPAEVVQLAQDTAAWLMAQAQALKPPFGFRWMEDVLQYYGGEYAESSAYECLRTVKKDVSVGI